MTEITHKDMLGRCLREGDLIAYSTKQGQNIARVLKLNDTTVSVQRVNEFLKPFGKIVTLKWLENVVIIEKENPCPT